MKVNFTHRNGRVEVMDERYAKILSGLKHGTYQTRDMVADRDYQVAQYPSDRKILKPVESEPKRRGRPPGVKPVDPAPVVDPTPEPVVPVEPEQATTEGETPKGEE